SVAGQVAPAGTKSTAGLPKPSAIVCVGPPLSASGWSSGSAVDPGVVPRQLPSGNEKLEELSSVLPGSFRKALWHCDGWFEATIELMAPSALPRAMPPPSDRVPAGVPVPPAPVELFAIVT